MIRVVIADDHAIVRDGLRRVLAGEPDLQLVAEAVDGADVLDKLRAHPCDVLVLDLSLPHLRGLELVHLLVEEFPRVRVLVFSVQPEDRLTVHLLQAGVAGYVGKDQDVDVVLDALRTVAAGRRWLSPQLRAMLGSAEDAAPHERLSPREAEVFRGLIRGLSVTAIAAELEMSVSTASNHLSRIREKLGVTHNGEVLVYAARAGLL